MRKTRKGGSYGPMPLKYFDASLTGPSANAGRDLLHASGMEIRPRIGGKRSKRTKRNKRGGFVPSVMGNFVQSSSKYIVPMALYAGYKLMTRKGSKRSRRH
jgi:hypothetical protein